MEHINYTLFEIIKYKIEFLDTLEYSMETYKLDNEEIKKNLLYLKKNLNEGMYKEIIFPLFTDYEKVNEYIFSFFKTYSYRKVIKMIKSKKVNLKIRFIKSIIDCHENLKYIVSSFTDEKEIAEKLDKRIINLIEVHNEHIKTFLFFIMFHLYINNLYPNKTKLKYKESDIKEIAAILKYCNDENKFEDYLNTLDKENELDINNSFEKLSNKCIELENKQSLKLKEIINLLNSELEKNKNDNIQL